MSAEAARPLFGLGRVLATPGVLADVAPAVLAGALARHARGDWGYLAEEIPEDAAANDAAVNDGSRIMSAYWLPGLMEEDVRIWIVTEAAAGDDPFPRFATTLLLPEEY